MNKKVFNFFIFGCFGIAAEIFFTATIDFIQQAKLGVYDFRLAGKSYIWMFFIYGIASLLIPPFYGLIKKHHFFVRLFFYAIGIFIIEFITGFLLDKITGDCPWHYTEGMHIMGYIRLDYLPYWMIFGGLLEGLHRQLED